MTYRIGIDIGSTTAKMAVVDEEGKCVWQRYERHNASVKPLLERFMAEVEPTVGEAELRVCVTGSVGMMTAELLEARFVQEVVAATTYARLRHPEANTLIDIGGEDSKVVLMEGSRAELRMNGNCAGGTGAFIDQMAALLGMSVGQLNALALQATRHHTMAARCGVFAKTDVQNLVSSHTPTEEIAASIFHSIAVQTVTTLAHGRELKPPILLCGGPLTFCSALRKAFADYMGLDEGALVVAEEGNLIPAIGCALSEGATPTTLSTLRQRVEGGQAPTLRSSLSRLFDSPEHYARWRTEKARFALPVEPLRAGREQVVVGIDSGSTTTKVVAARPGGEVVFCHYAQSHGHPIEAAVEGLRQLQRQADAAGSELEVVGTCATGYGEDLIRAALNLDDGIVETMAHYHAANRLMPGVSFILDIGGQDMKAIFLNGGIIRRMELNEACSSGCGTFLQTFAEGLGLSIDQFAEMACMAQHPCDLGTRCTVFMNSKVKQVLREGAAVGDIAAGLSYSVVNNCLHKVLKLQRREELGEKIVVQGGTMRNDAVVRALELLTGSEVARSSMPEMMGAYGCALHSAAHPTAPRSLSQLTDGTQPTLSTLTCKGCENRCKVARYHFGNGRDYYSGNRCERVFGAGGRRVERGENIYEHKRRLLFDRPCLEGEGRRRIGLARALGMYEEYPFWHRLLTACGMAVVLSPESEMDHYEAMLGTVMSDNICFPAKLAHSHVRQLADMGVERILMPYVTYDRQDDPTATNSYNCPIVSGYSDVIRNAMDVEVPIDAPPITFKDTALLRKQIRAYFGTLGIGRRQADRALDEALRAQAEYEQAIRQKAEEIYAHSCAKGRMAIMLSGRPYHTDPLVQHQLGEMVAAMGVDVISEDIARSQGLTEAVESNSVRQWVYVNRIMRGAQWVAERGAEVQMVEMTSFGCGPDSFVQDEVRDILNRKGKTLTLLKIDDVGNTGSLKLRVRSLIESIRQQGDQRGAARPFATTKVFKKTDAKRTILMPFISEYVSPLLEALAEVIGYRGVVVPPSDEESARIGLEYAHNEVCYPCTLVVGDLIKALQSGQYDPKETAVAMSQTGGQCRATNYAGLIKRAMVQAGFGEVPLIAVGVSGKGTANEQEGFDIDLRKLLPPLLWGLIFADAMAKMYYACVVREKEVGKAATLRDSYLQRAATLMRQHRAAELEPLLAEAAAEFDHWSVERDTCKVGIVGEIFLKFNHFSHQELPQQLIDRGYEVVPPMIMPFFTQEFVNREENERMGMSRRTLAGTVGRKALYQMVRWALKKANSAASGYRYFRPFVDIYAMEETVRGMVSPAAQFGEGWLLPAEVCEMAESGVENVISVQPFGCIANHVVARGIEKAIRKRYPDMNYLLLDFDSGVSGVNVTNRLLLFLDNARA